MTRSFSKIDFFYEEKIHRIEIINEYIKKLVKCNKLPIFNNKQNILSRLTIKIDNAENISKKIRDINIPSNTMYPMLVDRFSMFFDKTKYNSSYELKGKLLNLWSNEISFNSIEKTIKIIKNFSNK